MTHDIIVIGAGVSGLVAAKYLHRDCIVLEAQSRIGGRVHTREMKPDVYWDEGAHWIHDTGAQHIIYQKIPPDTPKFTWGKMLLIEPSGKQRDAESFWEDIEEFFQKLSDDSPDNALAEQISKSDPFFEHCIQTTSGRESFEVSRIEHALSKETGEDTIVPQGYGNFVLEELKNIPVHLNTAVTKIKWNKNGVELHTKQKIFYAKAVIITVSIGVLQSDCIEFDPPLPNSHLQAINSINMGYAERVYLPCAVRDDWVNGYFLVDLGAIVLGLECFPFGASYVSAYFAGNVAKRRDLKERAQQALRLAGYTGVIAKPYVSTWGQNPYTLGAYSSVQVGRYTQRKELTQPVPPLFFAGEATSKSFGTVHGAWESGVRVVKECIAWLENS